MTIPKGKLYVGIASQARIKFQDSSDDVRSFSAIRQMLKERKAALPHIQNVAKGVYVLISALWEAYCEDLAIEAATFMVNNASSWEQLPPVLKRKIAKDLRNDKHELSPWKLAGEGWRHHCLERLPGVVGAANMNTPKPVNVDELFSRAIGLEGLSRTWSEGKDGVDASQRLLDFIKVRGSIAHGGSPPVQVSPKMVSDFYQTVMLLAEETDEAVRVFIHSTIGSSPWGEASRVG